MPFRAKLHTMPLYVIYPRKTYVSTREKFATVEIHTLYVIRCKSVSLTLKQAKRASMRYRKVTKRATLSSLKPRAYRRNIVGQQLPILLDVTCCVRLHALLHVVGSCCIRLHTTANTDATTPNIAGPTMKGVAASSCKTKPHEYSVFLCFQNPRWRLHAGKFVETTLLLLAIVRFLHHILSL